MNIINTKNIFFLYVIMCKYNKSYFMKIGKTKCLESRIKNIQNGCPHKINDVFIITSEYEEEIIGLEHYIHYSLKKYKMTGEWYSVTPNFVCMFCTELSRINSNDFTFDEIEIISEVIKFESLEILLHNHEYTFLEVKKINGKYSQVELLDIIDLFGKIMNKIYIH